MMIKTQAFCRQQRSAEITRRKLSLVLRVRQFAWKNHVGLEALFAGCAMIHDHRWWLQSQRIISSETVVIYHGLEK
jgi:hypothetical protein